ncbi:aliphatic sulfonate ABC transporter substrate-binding protein [Teichococcus aestuarii]|uniref:Putative aliphatic sulfonates-binding protein n=1 Tax=Teichococcus aestuarii TaxID=568898 RepID=A0A2U1V110_9PROT|nr:aliphatic sulfonate ABC transporter substrate-binding protein [Pseudoroseomonas aestuarii]PWC27551.1 sulfonate ABC transporter substrate-binding protein [Pseudoroseomonas aestuarii]
MHRRTLARLSAGALSLPFLRGAGARAAGPAVLRIGWLRAPNDITTGRARGTLERAAAAQGARVEWAGPFAAAAPALEALNAGSIDITAGSSPACVTALSAGIPMVIFACQKIAPAAEGILVRQDSPVRSLADLRGRSVAVNRGGTGEYLLVRALERAGIDPASVRRAYLSPSDSGAAFVQGHVDAWASWDPFVTIAQRSHGARVLADGAAIGSDNAVTLMAHSDMAAHRRALLQAVFAACRADNDWAQAKPAEAGRIWTEAMGLPEALAPAIGANNAVPMRAPTEADVAQIERIADWYVANRIVRRRPDIAPAVVRLEG